MVGISQEIWCSTRETGRFHEQLGDSPGKPGGLAGMVMSHAQFFSKGYLS